MSRILNGLCINFILLLTLALNVGLVSGAQVSNDNGKRETELKLGELELKFNPCLKSKPKTGIICMYDGEPFSVGGECSISSLNWKETYLGMKDPKGYDVATEGQSNKYKSILIKLHSKYGQGYIRYSLRQGNVLDIECRLKLFAKPGRINFDVLRVAPELLFGLPFSAEMENGKIVEKNFDMARTDESRVILVKDLKKITINSRIGPLSIEKLSGNLPVQVADWRGRNWPSQPFFYIGSSGVVSKANSSNTLRLRVKFPSIKEEKTNLKKYIKVTDWRNSNVVKPITNNRPQLYPTPKHCKWSSGKCRLSPESTVVFRNVHKEDRKKLLNTLNNITYRKYAFFLNADSVDIKNPKVEISLFKQLVDKGSEYYELTVTPNKIMICANEPIGLQHGLRMLEEVLWNDPNQPAAICVDIKDWPSLAMRGVHCFSGKSSAELHTKFIERIFTMAKLNNIVYECGYVKWDATPLAHSNKYGMEKTDAAQVVTAMKANYLEPIPLIQSLGHIDWLNRNIINSKTGNRAYGEYFVSPTTYTTCFDPTKPEGVKFLEKIYDEVIEMFEPKYFHIGFDECFNGEAQLKGLSESTGMSPESLFIKQLYPLRKYLAQRNIRTIIWGDILLKRDDECPDYGHARSLKDAKRMREMIPKDVIIADWHYGNFQPEKFINIAVLQKDGFEVLGSTTYFPGNLIWFNTALKRAGSLGHLQTTWAGFNFDNEGFDKYFEQYYSYVLGAEAAWNGDYRQVKDVPFSFDKKFVEFWTKDDFAGLMKQDTKGRFVDLSKVTNVKLDGENWLGMAPENVPGAIKKLASSNVIFQTPNHKIDEAVLFDAKYNPSGDWPRELILDVDAKLDSLVFFQAASMEDSWDEEIASYVINYEDGSKYATPLRYGRNIFWYADTHRNRIWDNHNNPLVWEAKTKAGQPFAVRYMKVDNPHPEKTIKNITIESANGKAALILFGVIAFEK